MTTPHDVDVVIIGAGFAGLVAARELRSAGLRAVILEARDRLGGRTWTDERLGHRLEIGGTWVHWTQPHTWAEVTRYGVELVRSPRATTAYWLDGDGAVVTGDLDAFNRLLEPAQEQLVADSRAVFPRPDQPLGDARAAAADTQSLGDRFRELGLDGEALAVNESVWVGHVNGSLDDTALTAALRWSAATGGGWHAMHEASSSFKTVRGMDDFAARLAEDAGVDIHVGEVVRGITQDGDGVTVRTAGGREVRASRVLSTIPFAALAGVDVRPALPEPVRALGAEALANRGLKVWITVRGRVEPFVAYSTQSHAVSVLKAEVLADDHTVLVGFGPDHTRFDASTTADAQAAVNVWRDDLEVLGVAVHDWMGDEFSRTTWQLLRPGYLHHLPATQVPAGRLHFASSDNANLWPGFIDGAIESALRESRAIVAAIRRDRAATEGVPA